MQLVIIKLVKYVKNLTMSKVYIPLVFDSVFTSFFVFLGLLSLSSTFAERKVALAVSVVLSALFLYVFAFFYFKKLKRNYATVKDKALADDLFFTLPQLPEPQKEKFFCAIATNPLRSVYEFRFSPLTVDDVLTKIEKSPLPVTFYGVAFNDECVKFFKSETRAKLVYGNELFNLAKEKNALPDDLLSSRRKVTVKELFVNLIKKENSKKLFWFAVFFISFSFITPFRLYYAISGCIFLALSLSRFLSR